jgi:hypothetical protein
VPNCKIDSATEYGRISLSTWENVAFPEQNKLAPMEEDFLDALPVMPATVLGLDMLLQEPSVDLRMATELILSDVGATLRILRLIGKEYDIAAERPNRISECIASLDVNAWFGAISAGTFVGDWEHSATTAVWKHCRLIAQYSQLVAESLDDVFPDDAYLVGLLHGIEAIPGALGWPYGGRGDHEKEVLRELLPLFVLDALQSMRDSTSSSVWRFILTAAHKLAGSRSNEMHLISES